MIQSAKRKIRPRQIPHTSYSQDFRTIHQAVSEIRRGTDRRTDGQTDRRTDGQTDDGRQAMT